MIALYFDPAQPRDGHGRWSTLSGATHVQRASDEARDLAAWHDAVQASATPAARGLHRATYHAARAQHLINEHALGRSVDDAALDDHLSSLSRIVSSLRAAGQRGSSQGAATEHYASMLSGLRAARRAGTGVHVAHHFGEPLSGAPDDTPTHLQGVLRPQRPAPTETTLAGQFQAIHRMERTTAHVLRRENVRHALGSLDRYAQARRAVVDGDVARGARLFHEAAARATRFDPSQIRSPAEARVISGALDDARDATAHALYAHQPDPATDAEVARLKDEMNDLSAPQANMVKHGYQFEPYTGGDFFAGHDHEYAGPTDAQHARAFARATGCATFAEFRRRLLGDHPLIDHAQTSVTVTPHDSSSGGKTYHVTAELTDAQGGALGILTRKLHPDSGLVINDMLALEKHVQGGGIGPNLYQSHEEAWRAAGYTHMTTTANIDAGGYAWATHGFDYDPNVLHGLKVEGHRSLVRAEMDNLLTTRQIDAATHAKYVRVLAHCRYPWDFARFTVDAPGLDEDARLVGRKALLGLAKTWSGVKYLSDTHPGNRVSNATRRKKGVKESA